MFRDLPEAQLREYYSDQVAPADFDEFWRGTLADAQSHPLNVTLTPVATPLSTVDVYDVRFAGFDGQEIAAWFRVPAGTSAPLPAVVQFHGYGRGRGAAVENLLWASAGFAHLELDTRGQGWSGSRGVTPDPHGGAAQAPGFVTRGIESREDYYYRRVFTDAVRAVAATRELALVDGTRVGVFGTSQGGGIALAVAGLVPDLAHVVARVPFLCDFPRATVITDASPFREIGDYLAHHRDRAAAVADTLSYFDGVNFAARATAPLTMTVGLMDPVCPPSTVYAAFNAYAGPKDLTTWAWNGHEGGGLEDDLLTVAAFRTAFGDAATRP